MKVSIRITSVTTTHVFQHINMDFTILQICLS